MKDEIVYSLTFFGPDKHYENDWTLPDETPPKENDQLEAWATAKGLRGPLVGESYPAYRRSITEMYTRYTA